MKIGFYLPNRGICQTDLRKVDYGNPGIGGSEFSVVLIASNLAKDKQIEVELLCDYDGIFPAILPYKVCNSIYGALSYAEKMKFNVIVIDSRLLNEHILIRYNKTKFVAWANCFVENADLDLLAQHENVMRIVNVGKHQHFLLSDTICAMKSIYIYNAVPTKILNQFRERIIPICKRKHNVVYIGSLHKAKGFHCLAKVWSYVLKSVSDAELYVIGSGSLYSKNAKLGKYGIASQEYEDEFMPYLTNKGQIMPSVHFMGVMGEDKYELLSQCKVGVPNPWGHSETFGFTACEMEMMGCHVTTIKCPGYLDTVYKQANLYTDIKDLGKYIVRLLNTDDLDYDETINYLKRFSVETVINDWRKLFYKINEETLYTKVSSTSYLKSFLICIYHQLKSIIKNQLKKSIIL